MNCMRRFFFHGYREDRGQALVMAPIILAFLVAFSAFVVDMGNLYYSYQELLGNAQAAARAGGKAMPDAAVTSVSNVAYQYSGWSSAPTTPIYNVHANLNITSATVKYACVSATTYPNLNLPPCAAYPSYPACPVTTANPAGGCNAIQVVESATVPTFFAKYFGITSLPITATASASASGGGAIPYHIMMVLDTTSSMGSGSDSGCVVGGKGTMSPEQCAQNGVQTLLSELAPCASNLASCGSSPVVDEVGLMAFPGVCSDTASGVTTANCPTLASSAPLTNTVANATYTPDDYTCPAKNPPITPYNNNPEYLVIPFASNYRASDTAALNFSSNLVEAVGAGTGSCGMPTPGGEGTFYGGVIIAAQQYLIAHHTANVQDVMIVLSDGNASASPAQMGGAVKQTQTVAGMSGSLFLSTGECTQAVNAAKWAKGYKETDGTTTEIYSVSYGSETSGCTSGETSPYNTPCGTMAGIASTPLSQYFFSVPQTVAGKTSTVCSGAVPITQLNQVFTTIGGDLHGARLIPNTIF
jgi:hypothetical protein